MQTMCVAAAVVFKICNFRKYITYYIQARMLFCASPPTQFFFFFFLVFPPISLFVLLCAGVRFLASRDLRGVGSRGGG
jgi:hypothetical protein